MDSESSELIWQLVSQERIFWNTLYLYENKDEQIGHVLTTNESLKDFHTFVKTNRLNKWAIESIGVRCPILNKQSINIFKDWRLLIMRPEPINTLTFFRTTCVDRRDSFTLQKSFIVISRFEWVSLFAVNWLPWSHENPLVTPVWIR
jgi:hypothetical protein